MNLKWEYAAFQFHKDIEVENVMTHAFVPQHLQVFAKYLFRHNFSDEKYDLQCIYRTVVNRAYLSTYLHTHDWIVDNGPYMNIKEYGGGNIGYHAAILLGLKYLKKFDIYRKYSDFLDLRVSADYDVVGIVTPNDAKTAIELAEEICNSLK